MGSNIAICLMLQVEEHRVHSRHWHVSHILNATHTHYTKSNKRNTYKAEPISRNVCIWHNTDDPLHLAHTTPWTESYSRHSRVACDC